MQFLKGLFWFLLAVVAAVFVLGNWTSVTIRLWSGLVAEVNLPLLLLVAFLLGLLPTWLYHHAIRWRLRSRLANAERAIADLTAAPPLTPPAPILDPIPPEPA
jgi:lipopolysaccharide assembly protein A